MSIKFDGENLRQVHAGWRRSVRLTLHFRHHLWSARRSALEGMVAKHRESSYRGGRFRHWVKVKNRKHPAFVRVRDQY